MALLTEVDLAYLRSEIGTAVDEDDVQDRYDRLGSVRAVAAEVVRQRLADLLTGPGSFAVSGVYSESNDAVIRALQATSARLELAAERDVTPAATLHRIPAGRLTRHDRAR